MHDLLLNRLLEAEVLEKQNMMALPAVDRLKSFLEAPNVRIKDLPSVESKLWKIISGGADKLMVISDFDFTLTKFKDEHGRKHWSSPGLFDHLAKELNPPLAEEFTRLCKKYIPIEFDPHLSMEEKIPHMEDFWKISHKLTISGGFKRETIEQFVKERCRIALRDGGVELMEKLHDHGVPLVVFSAGVGDVIDIFLRHTLQRETLPPNIHLISNMIEYDENDQIAAFSEPLIHTFCKNSSVIKKEAGFFHHINQRTNVLLLGDSLGDTNMDVGVEKHGPTLKIGFLNHKCEELIDTFMEIYDIVIVAETSIHLPSAIVDSVIRKGD